MENHRPIARGMLIVVGGVLAALGVTVFAIESVAEWREMHAAAEERAVAGLTMLEALHAETMLNRVLVGDGDPTVATLNGVIEQYKKSNSDLRMWLVMGPKVIAYQTAKGHKEIERPVDAVDGLAISSGQRQSARANGLLRVTNPVVMGAGHAADQRCAACHTDLMGIGKGEVIGAVSAQVDLRPRIAAWRSQTWRQALIGTAIFGLALAGIATLLGASTWRPLRFLASATQRLAGGQTDVELAGGERRDEFGVLARSLEVFRSLVAEKGHSDAKIAHMAMHDHLTGLPNREHFEQFLDQAMQAHAESGLKVAVVSMDIDQLKALNEMHGYATGDEMLKSLSRAMAATLADGECVARVGGDEFTAVKSIREQDDLLAFVGRLEACLFASYAIGDATVKPGAKIGVAIFPDDAASKDELVNRADMALHRAKADSERVICFYEAAVDEAARYRRRLVNDLRGAIGRHEFTLVYQPQKSIRTSAIIGYEALLRWEHPQLGNISPKVFIPLAEQCGAIFEIGDWVLRTACKEAAGWPEPVNLAVNLSPVQLSDDDLPERIHDILLETGLAAERLEVEITESAIIGDKVRALRILEKLKAMHVTIALDDFGTGYSSLETLKSFPFSKIKLDRSFVRELGENAQATAIVRAIVTLGHSLSMPVLAEGIETDRQLELLKSENCDEVQGYLCGRPQGVIGLGDNKVELPLRDAV